MKNKVIKSLTPEMGPKIIRFFRKKGADTYGFTGYQNEEEGHSHCYYGVIAGKFDFFDSQTVFENKAKIIELPIKKSKE